jgi:glycosyltransferase involved in cell wall biosynthesis
MQAILLSNVPHYHYLARALEDAGFLKRYITAVALDDGARAPGWLPPRWRQKLEGRRLKGIPQGKVRQLWLPEMLQQGLPAARLCSVERSNAINNALFDRMARRWVDRCDVFHFVSSVGLGCAREAKGRGACLICDVRQAHPKAQNEVLREEGRRLGLALTLTGWSYESRVLEEFALADYIVVPSDYAKRTFLEQGFSGDHVFVNAYGVDLSCFQPAQPPQGIFRIICSGAVTARKGVHYLLRAVKELQLPKVKVVLVGGMNPEMVPVLRPYGEWFEHHPAVSRTELARHYQESSLFVLPSLSDSFGLVVIEAMACGLPVIVSDRTGAGETVRDGLEGFVVPARDVETLKEKVLTLYENADLRAEMGRAAARKAQEISWDNYGRRAVEFYTRLEVGI